MKITLWRIGRYRNVSATGFGTSRKGMEVQDAEDKRKKKMKSATVRTTYHLTCCRSTAGL